MAEQQNPYFEEVKVFVPRALWEEYETARQAVTEWVCSTDALPNERDWPRYPTDLLQPAMRREAKRLKKILAELEAH